jgi:hypothetical protein
MVTVLTKLGACARKQFLHIVVGTVRVPSFANGARSVPATLKSAKFFLCRLLNEGFETGLAEGGKESQANCMNRAAPML